MKIQFQKKDFNFTKEFNKFRDINKESGAVISFLGKVRPTNKQNKITSIDIEYYKKMATLQSKKKILDLKKLYNIDDYLLIHRHGNIKVDKNIVLVLVASKHRKEGFEFIENLIDWLKIKITFWKKENFKNGASWVKPDEKDLKKTELSAN